jgi:hypothetical protein
MDFYCEKCKKTMDEKNFYKSNNVEKYPQGKLNKCKNCLTMHVDNWNSETYLWILQECDVPYIPEEWHKLMANYAQKKTKLTGTTILGRYLAKMQLKQWRDYRWCDTEFLQELNNAKIKETMERQGYDAQQITEVLTKATFSIPEKELTEPDPIPKTPTVDAETFLKSFMGYGDLPSPEEFGEPQVEYEDYFSTIGPAPEKDFNDDLTEEDRVRLRLKWGKTYKPEEWIRLEQLYEGMMASYDIQQEGDLNTLILVCKTSLKANQLLDIGDIDGAQKATKMYENLMKAGKWTAAQNKSEESEVIDSIGELVAICEKEGFIPRYYTDGPQDLPDKVILDMQKYTYDLITNETGLSTMIENAIKQIEEENERIREAAEGKEDSKDELDKMFDYDEEVIETADYIEFQDYEEDLKDIDDKNLKALLESEEY